MLYPVITIPISMTLPMMHRELTIMRLALQFPWNLLALWLLMILQRHLYSQLQQEPEKNRVFFSSAFMTAQLKQDGVDVQGMLDNDIIGSSTADDGTIDKFDLRVFVQGIPTIDNSSEISELTAIGAENDSPAHQLGRFVSEASQNTLTQMNGMWLKPQLGFIYESALGSLINFHQVRTIYRPDRFLHGGDETIYHSLIKVSQLFDSPNLMKTLHISIKTRE
jgi:hypothetical protein